MVPGCRLWHGWRSSAWLLLAGLVGCKALPQAPVDPRVEFTRVPEARLGGPKAVAAIEGRAIGARRGQRIVLFAKSDIWWVQPFASEPFTLVNSDFLWKGTTHFGTEYAALLVDSTYFPPTKTRDLLKMGGPVVAVAQVKGREFETVDASRQGKEIRFSGFDWDVRYEPSDRGGGKNDYDPANAWVDEKGRLHLRITSGRNGWKCSEVRLKDSLGYGTYAFTVQDRGYVEPGAVLGIYTYDYTAPSENHREMNIEVSRWGELYDKNAQFAVQPYYVPANVVRFTVPLGTLTHSLRWSPGRADFKTIGRSSLRTERPVADFTFTSGVPTAGEETVFIALYAYGKARHPLTKDTEAVIERFDYIP